MALYGDDDQADIAALDGAAHASKPRPLWYAPRFDATAVCSGLAVSGAAGGGAAPDTSFARCTIRRTRPGFRRHVALARTPADGTSIRNSAEDPAAGSRRGVAPPSGARRARFGPESGAAPASGSTTTASVRPTTCAGQLWSAPGWPR